MEMCNLRAIKSQGPQSSRKQPLAQLQRNGALSRIAAINLQRLPKMSSGAFVRHRFAWARGGALNNAPFTAKAPSRGPFSMDMQHPGHGPACGSEHRLDLVGHGLRRD